MTVPTTPLSVDLERRRLGGWLLGGAAAVALTACGGGGGGDDDSSSKSLRAAYDQMVEGMGKQEAVNVVGRNPDRGSIDVDGFAWYSGNETLEVNFAAVGFTDQIVITFAEWRNGSQELSKRLV